MITQQILFKNQSALFDIIVASGVAKVWLCVALASPKHTLLFLQFWEMHHKHPHKSLIINFPGEAKPQIVLEMRAQPPPATPLIVVRSGGSDRERNSKGFDIL